MRDHMGGINVGGDNLKINLTSLANWLWWRSTPRQKTVSHVPRWGLVKCGH